MSGYERLNVSIYDMALSEYNLYESGMDLSQNIIKNKNWFPKYTKNFPKKHTAFKETTGRFPHRLMLGLKILQRPTRSDQRIPQKYMIHTSLQKYTSTYSSCIFFPETMHQTGKSV